MTRHLFAALALAVTLVAGVLGQGAPPTAPPPSPQPPSQPAAAQPGLTFKAEVNYVEVDARVVDAQGKFVSDLSHSDFQVFEDGKPQKVTIFSLVNIPVERPERPLFASQPIEPDVQTNVRGYDGRIYLIVLDDLHTHPLRSSRVKLAARQFVERYIGANDQAAVVTIGGRNEATQDFTSNPRLLLDAIDKFIGRKLRSSVMNRIDEEARTRDTRQPGDKITDPDDMERGFQARNTFDTLKGLAEFLEGVRGRRKALVLFSEGVDYDITDPFNNRDATTVLDASRDAIAAATRANVAIYAIDPRGLGAGSDDLIEIQSFPDDPTLNLGTTALYNEVRLGQDSMRVLADETGGYAAVNNNDIAGAFQRVVDDNSSYYVLGFYPANDRRDGRFRKLEVKVNRPGVTVRARRGYVAPRGRAPETKLAGPNDASPELREAMTSPLPMAGLPLSATASVFKGPAPNGSVVISVLVGGRDLPLTEKDGMFHNDLEVAFMAVNKAGKIFNGDRNTLNLKLKPDTVPRLRAGGFRVISAMDLPPGQYRLRVAASEANTKRSGSIIYDLEVPEFGKQPLVMSGIALTSASSSMSPTARPKDPLAKLLPGPLTSYREFAQNDEIALFTEVYDSSAKQAHTVEITLTAKAEGGQTVFQSREERESAELAGSTGGGYGFVGRIPLRDFAPGLYVLRVEAQSQIGDRPSINRELVFRVVPGSPAARPTAAAPAPASGRGGSGASPGVAPPKPPESPARGAVVPVAPVAPVAMTTVANDLMSGIDTARTAVARTAAEFETLWRAHAPGRATPAIDFAKNMVVAVFLGSRPSSGFQVEISDARREGDALVVRWAERRPGRDQMAAQVMTAPAHLVAVPRVDGQVRFEKVESPPGD